MCTAALRVIVLLNVMCQAMRIPAEQVQLAAIRALRQLCEFGSSEQLFSSAAELQGEATL